MIGKTKKITKNIKNYKKLTKIIKNFQLFLPFLISPFSKEKGYILSIKLYKTYATLYRCINAELMFYTVKIE